MNISRIMTLDTDGFASWGYHVSDDLYQVAGKALSSDELPRARFQFVGKIRTPAPPPDRLDVEVLTYWSALRCYGGTEEFLKSWWSNKPSYSNICHIVNLKIPSDLPKESYDYQARLKVHPQQCNREQKRDLTSTIYGTHVTRPDNPVEVTHSIVDSERKFKTGMR